MSSRMAGQIVARGEGTWLVRVYLGSDQETKKRKYHNKTIKGTKKDAQKYLNGVLRAQDLGTFVEPTSMTLTTYLEKWLENAAKPRLSVRTLTDYRWLLTNYVKPTLGFRRLADVRPLEIQSLYSELSQRGLSARTVRYTHSVLSSALKQAVMWQMLSQNPASFVQLPKLVKTEMSAMAPEDADRFLKAARGTPFEVLLTVALVSGMRPGEYMALQWKDVDIKAGTVTVQRALSRTKGAWEFKDPKTARSKRTIPLPPSVVRMLEVYKRQQAEEILAAGADYQRHDLVFATGTGNPLDEVNLSKRHFKPILKAAGLPLALRLYDLRHSCATLLLAKGENPKIVSERLGHASITLTLDTYSHVLPTMQQGAADKLEELLFRSAERG